jgi:hypothetical protein
MPRAESDCAPDTGESGLNRDVPRGAGRAASAATAFRRRAWHRHVGNRGSRWPRGAGGLGPCGVRRPLSGDGSAGWAPDTLAAAAVVARDFRHRLGSRRRYPCRVLAAVPSRRWRPQRRGLRTGRPVHPAESGRPRRGSTAAPRARSARLQRREIRARSAQFGRNGPGDACFAHFGRSTLRSIRAGGARGDVRRIRCRGTGRRRSRASPRVGLGRAHRSA